MQHIDSNVGTAMAVKGSIERVLNPELFDAIFPLIAFTLVFLVPTAVAIWVIIKTVKHKDLADGKR